MIVVLFMITTVFRPGIQAIIFDILSSVRFGYLPLSAAAPTKIENLITMRMQKSTSTPDAPHTINIY